MHLPYRVLYQLSALDRFGHCCATATVNVCLSGVRYFTAVATINSTSPLDNSSCYKS